MENKTIHITQVDLKHLKDLIREAQIAGRRNTEYLEKLDRQLERAEIVDPHDIPADAITMNSQVVLFDTESAEELSCTLVFPKDADIEQDKISILSPIGTAMLGYRAGDKFEWDTSGGIRMLRVKSVLYQPEAAGLDLIL